MPDDIKIKYLNWIINVYNVGIATISQIVFNQSTAALGLYLKRNPDIRSYVNCPKKGGKMDSKYTQKLKEDVDRARNPKLEVEEAKEPIDISEPEAPYSPDDLIIKGYEPPVTTMKKLDFVMDGLDIEFIKAMAERFGDSKIRISVSLEVME